MKTILLILLIATSAGAVDTNFLAGFEAGVKYGILSYMQNPTEDDVRVHTEEAKKWYWLVVVDWQANVLLDTKASIGICCPNSRCLCGSLSFQVDIRWPE